MINYKRETLSVFDELNLDQLPFQWLDEVLENDFNYSPSGDETFFCPTDNMLDVLNLAINNCIEWRDRMESSKASGNDSESDESLWECLRSGDVSVNNILQLVYLLLHSLFEQSEDLKEALSLAGAKLYLVFLSVRGSSAHGVYRSTLFNMCIETLKFDMKNAHVYYIQYIEILDVLLPVLRNFDLTRDDGIMLSIFKKLSYCFGCHASSLNFADDMWSMSKERRRRLPPTLVLASLSYQGYMCLLSNKYDESTEQTFYLICASLSPYVLSAISKPDQAVRANAVSFIEMQLRRDSEKFSQSVMDFLKLLCVRVPDKQDYRKTTSPSIDHLMHLLTIEDQALFRRWLIDLGNCNEIRKRVFALEMYSNLLQNKKPCDISKVPKEMQVYMTLIPTVFVVLTRCSDSAANVRSKALSVMSQNMGRIVSLVNDVDISQFPLEEFDDSEISENNGDNHYFWYNMDSVQDILDQIMNVLYDRMEDASANTTKAAFEALEKLATYDENCLSKTYLQLFYKASKDNSVSVRKQMIQSIENVLQKYESNKLVQTAWIECVFPLVQDTEKSAQSLALDTLEKKFLHGIFTANYGDVFLMLKEILNCDIMIYSKYLLKAFSCWKKERKLNPSKLMILMQHLGEGSDECVWFYLWAFGQYCNIPNRITVAAVAELEKIFKEDVTEVSPNLEQLLLFLFCVCKDLDNQTMDRLRGICYKKLENLDIPVEIIHLLVFIIMNLDHLRGDHSKLFFEKRIEKSLSVIKYYKKKCPNQDQPDKLLAMKYITMLTKICAADPQLISKSVLSDLEYVVANANKKDIKKIVMPENILAHTYGAIGSLCHQVQKMAEFMVKYFALGIERSSSSAMKNNCTLVLLEMVKQYPYLTEQYMPLICKCFKEKDFLVRFQTLSLIMSLLQNEKIKAGGALGGLFYCLLHCVIDKDERIQQRGHYILIQLIFNKKNTIFLDSFIDTMFVLNRVCPVANDVLSQTVKNMKYLQLEQKKDRMDIYEYMLKYIQFKDRLGLIREINKFLEEISLEKYNLEKSNGAASMMRDCFAVLSNPEIVCIASEVQVTADLSINMKFLHNRAKEAFIHSLIMPTITLLKQTLRETKSDCYNDLAAFLADILADFKDIIQEFIPGDAQLLSTVKMEWNKKADASYADELKKGKKGKKSQKKSLVMARSSRNKSDVNTASSSADLSRQCTVVLSRCDSMYAEANGAVIGTVDNGDPVQSISEDLGNDVEMAEAGPSSSNGMLESNNEENVMMMSHPSSVVQSTPHPNIALKSLKIDDLNVSRIDKLVFSDSDDD